MAQIRYQSEKESAPFKKFYTYALVLLAAIAGAYRAAGIKSLSLAIATLVMGISGFVLETVWYSSWIKRTGRWKPTILQISGSAAAFLSLAISIPIVTSVNRQELKEPEGLLYPASDPMPANDCIRRFRLHGLEPNSYFMLFGQSASVFNRFPHDVLSVDTTPVLWLTQDKAGHIGVNLDVMENGILMTRIRDGHFIVNPGTVFHFERADRSTLDVIDQHGTQVLHIRFMNPEIISVNGLIGRFFIPPYQPGQPAMICTGYSGGSDIRYTTHQASQPSSPGQP
jgi:hypothetical protein